MKPILICGAGIAGLGLARLFSMNSIPYKIIEKATGITAEGAGIALPANAVHLIDYMGLGSIIRDSSHRVRTVTYVSPEEHLSTASLEEAPLNQNYFLALPRAELHRILMSSLSDEVFFSTRINSVIEREDGVTVLLNQNGNLVEEEFGAIIGADGIHSTIRETVFPEHTTNDFGLTIWRWISDWNVGETITEPFYMFDIDRVFMVYPISATEVYCYAHVVNSSDIKYTAENSIEAIKQLFAHCSHQIIRDMLVKLTATTSIIIGKMESVESPAFSKGRICLVGDACHACTPMLQQGAALAFEDAVILSNLLKNFSIDDALKFYSELRFDKVTNIVRSSNAPIRQLSSPEVDIEAIYENIRNNGPLNVQGWRKILSSESVFEELDKFVSSKKRQKSSVHFEFASHDLTPSSSEGHEIIYSFVKDYPNISIPEGIKSLK